jgi:hypothetical protein
MSTNKVKDNWEDDSEEETEEVFELPNTETQPQQTILPGEQNKNKNVKVNDPNDESKESSKNEYDDDEYNEYNEDEYNEDEYDEDEYDDHCNEMDKKMGNYVKFR